MDIGLAGKTMVIGEGSSVARIDVLVNYVGIDYPILFVDSKPELRDNRTAIKEDIAVNNDNPNPFIWTSAANAILKQVSMCSYSVRPFYCETASIRMLSGQT
ncbi:MAG: hypothetical protein PHV74_10860 [Dehalococcoidia bacterium]|nr:hypothetical protein [Dehalococcoidia bacterium]